MTWPCFALGMDCFRWGKVSKCPIRPVDELKVLALEEDASSDWGVLRNAGPGGHWSKLVPHELFCQQYLFEIAGSQLENEKSEHVPQHVTCEIHQQFSQLMPCKCVTWEFANDMFNMLMNCHVSIGIWPWHVQHADDMPSCFTWEFDHDMSTMPMTCNMPRIWVYGTTCWLVFNHRLPTMDITW